MLKLKGKSTSDKITEFLKDIPSGKIFNYNDLNSCGDNSNVRSAVLHLTNKKVIIRVAQGLYMKYEENAPDPDIIYIAKELGRRNNEQIQIDEKSYKNALKNSFINQKIFIYTNGTTRTIRYKGISFRFIKK